MKSFTYKIIDANGDVKEGVLEASAADDARSQLSSDGSMIVSVAEQKAGGSGKSSFSFGKPIKLQDIINFTRQLKSLISAGLPLVESIESIQSNVEHKEFKAILGAMHGKMTGGTPFSACLDAHPDLFSESYRAMAKAGEATGKLIEVLHELSLMLDWEKKLSKEVKGALRYPITAISVSSFALIFIVTFVVPKFAGFYSAQSAELPAITNMLLLANKVIVSYWWIVLGIVAGLIYTVKMMKKKPDSRLIVDSLMLKIPILGALSIKYMSARFAKVFALLYRSGVSVIPSLEISERLFSNEVYVREIVRLKTEITNGRKLSESMQDSTFFEKLAKQMVDIGERSGNLTEMMVNIANFYSEDLEYVIENSMAIIQPILIIVIGAMVSLIALGMFMPMWSMMDIM
ncbi:MAG: type II secretory pathway component PulF [Candidatus Marinamargulisbacteria bacterium]|jgi:type II secretory pathway component PulF